jgi:hypothetical protein
VAPPAGRDDWEIRFLDTKAANGWEELRRRAPGNTATAWNLLRRNPAPIVPSPRHHRLRHNLATGNVKGPALEHWQIEVTGAGRFWYLVDHDNRTVWIDHAGPGHPKAAV